MASVNKVIIMGNVGRDPEMRYLPSGMAACNISVATSSKRKDKNTGETIEDTQWHRVQFFDRLAEICGEYVKKGRPVYVEGRLKYRKYTGQDGVEKNTVDIVATELQLLGSGGHDDKFGPEGQRPKQEPQRQAPAPAASGGFDYMDDDIPFRDPMACRGFHLVV